MLKNRNHESKKIAGETKRKSPYKRGGGGKYRKGGDWRGEKKRVSGIVLITKIEAGGGFPAVAKPRKEKKKIKNLKKNKNKRQGKRKKRL